MDSSKEQGTSRPDTSSLARRLTEAGYTELFLRAGDEAREGFWSESGGPPALRELAADEGAPELARFLAAEITFRKLDDYPSPEERKVLAPLYVKALVGNFTRMANSWGFPGLSLAPAGEHFVRLGEEAVPGLARLLDDETELPYGGSREVMSAAYYGYRVKDAAAYFISRIRGLPFEAHRSPTARDEEIEKLKSSLK